MELSNGKGEGGDPQGAEGAEGQAVCQARPPQRKPGPHNSLETLHSALEAQRCFSRPDSVSQVPSARDENPHSSHTEKQQTTRVHACTAHAHATRLGF